MLTHPRPAVLSVALRGNEVLLVRRANPPDAGLWGFPGGKLDLGETLAEAALRELKEETGLTALSAGPVLGAQDVIVPGEALTGSPDESQGSSPPPPLFHYVLIALRCELPENAPPPQAADDALEARWVAVDEIAALSCSEGVETLARQALGRATD
ncbi:NUDIX hydrolase [Oceanicola sp. S124]|uniref:NUDIX hydrolase n=1 Tax=Oceanicola sp. S124 TaxID=1042378 RepID=UPI0002559761|nr:NUDIX hydrolase [Oceanicola sp. S124]